MRKPEGGISVQQIVKDFFKVNRNGRFTAKAAFEAIPQDKRKMSRAVIRDTISRLAHDEEEELDIVGIEQTSHGKVNVYGINENSDGVSKIHHYEKLKYMLSCGTW